MLLISLLYALVYSREIGFSEPYLRNAIPANNTILNTFVDAMMPIFWDLYANTLCADKHNSDLYFSIYAYNVSRFDDYFNYHKARILSHWQDRFVHIVDNIYDYNRIIDAYNYTFDCIQKYFHLAFADLLCHPWDENEYKNDYIAIV